MFSRRKGGEVSAVWPGGRRGTRQSQSAEGRQRYEEVFTFTVYQTEHPLVHVQPETGERSLIVGHFVQRLVGYGTADSRHLLEIFHDHATKPENTVRWRWQAGDVAIWDNRATLHRAVDDYGDQPRVVRRVTIAGEVPVSVDGRRSVTRGKYARCLIPGFDGALFTSEWKDALWARFSMGAPRRQRRSVERYSIVKRA